MKKNGSGKRGFQDAAPPDRVGWIRKFCGRGIFREIWKNRFVVLRGDHLMVCEKEGREAAPDQVLDLCDFHSCDELRKNKSRSKKNHSKFRLQPCSSSAPDLVFLAVSPEDKESWIHILNAAISRAKNRVLDEVTVVDTQLSHMTRHRARIPHCRRPPTRGHLLAVASASSSDGTLILDLIREEDASSAGTSKPDRDLDLLVPDCPRSRTEGTIFEGMAGAGVKSRSLPREVATITPMAVEKNRCVSMDEIHAKTRAAAVAHPPARSPGAPPPIERLQELIGQKLEETQRLLLEAKQDLDLLEHGDKVQRLLKEATATWGQARLVLDQVQELRALYRLLDPTNTHRA